MVQTIADTSAKLTRVLTPEELAFFSKNGYLHIKHFVDRETVDTFLREI